jgi:hypothetical protein
MILGYQCDKCKAIVDEVQRVAVYLGDESAVLHDYWFCEDCVNEMLVELNKVYKDNIVGITGETKQVDIFKVHKSKMGRR